MRPIGKIHSLMTSQIKASIRTRLAFNSLLGLADSVQASAASVHLHSFGALRPDSHNVDKHLQQSVQPIANAVLLDAYIRPGMRQPQTFGSFYDIARERTEGSPKRRSSSRTLEQAPTLDLSKLLWLFRKLVKLVEGPSTTKPRDALRGRSGQQPQDRSLKAASSRLLRGISGLTKVLTAPLIPALIRALDFTALAVDRLTQVAKTHSIASAAALAFALIGIGAIAGFLRDTILASVMEGIGVLRWSLRIGATSTIFLLVKPLSSIARFAIVLADSLLGWYLVIAAIAAIAGYELYRHWETAKRLLSRSVESMHKAVARLLKWLAESAGGTISFARDALVALKPGSRNASRLSAARATMAPGMTTARAIEHVATVAWPSRMLPAVRRAAAFTAIATPLLLAAGPANAFGTPFNSTSDAARVAAPPSAMGVTQAPIVLNYAPNVVIHSEGAIDTAALKRRVIEILERHGRELHQVLSREIIRQQRRDFVNPALDE